MTYAANTTVSVEKSRAELERILTRYGADAFAYGWQGVEARVQFRANGKQVRFVIPLPDFEEFKRYKRGGSTYLRSEAEAEKRWEQASRVRWRGLCLVVKAKLEAVEAGIAEFEDEFLAYIVLPSGETTGEWMRPQLDVVYESGMMPDELRLALPKGDG